MKILVQTFLVQNFPRPDFNSGYTYPEYHLPVSHEALLSYIDIVILVMLMSFVSWAVIKKQVRWPVILTSVLSVAYFGFFRHGCVCSIGSIQNVALMLASNTYHIPLFVLILFILPLVFAIFFGRVFCAGVCPLGALQELVNIKNYPVSKVVSGILGLFPWIYLGFAILLAATNSRFIVCHFDPFVGIFRLGGEFLILIFGVLLLFLSIFTGRPFCRFICPYGVILSLFSRISFWQVKITKKECNNCQLCHQACPVDAIRAPYENKIKESRSVGVNRILRYMVFFPVMVIAGSLVMYLLSDRFSRVNSQVRLFEMVQANERLPQKIQSLELQAFYGQERSTHDLTEQVTEIKRQFRKISAMTGAFFGLIIATTLIRLSVKRTRKQYGIDKTNCVSCGRCFSYCPYNKHS